MRKPWTGYKFKTPWGFTRIFLGGCVLLLSLIWFAEYPLMGLVVNVTFEQKLSATIGVITIMLLMYTIYETIKVGQIQEEQTHLIQRQNFINSTPYLRLRIGPMGNSLILSNEGLGMMFNVRFGPLSFPIEGSIFPFKIPSISMLKPGGQEEITFHAIAGRNEVAESQINHAIKKQFVICGTYDDIESQNRQDFEGYPFQFSRDRGYTDGFKNDLYGALG